MFNPVGAGGISSTAVGHGPLRAGAAERRRTRRQAHPEAGNAGPDVDTAISRQRPAMPPICMGFYQDWRNELRWIGHEGDLIAFHSLFFVEPKQNLVLFVSYNSAGGGGKPRPEMIDSFSDRYFPGPPNVKFIEKPSGDFRDIVGTYQSTRRADSTKLRMQELGAQSGAHVDKNGVLTISDFKDMRDHTIKWKLIGKDLWQAEDDQRRIFAIRDSRNRVVRLAGNFPGVQMERVSWWENARWIGPALVASYGILCIVVLTSLLRVGRRIFLRKRQRWHPQPGTLWLTFMPRTAAFLWVLFVTALAGFFIVKGDDLLPPTRSGSRTWTQ